LLQPLGSCPISNCSKRLPFVRRTPPSGDAISNGDLAQHQCGFVFPRIVPRPPRPHEHGPFSAPRPLPILPRSSRSSSPTSRRGGLIAGSRVLGFSRHRPRRVARVIVLYGGRPVPDLYSPSPCVLLHAVDSFDRVLTHQRLPYGPTSKCSGRLRPSSGAQDPIRNLVATRLRTADAGSRVRRCFAPA